MIIIIIIIIVTQINLQKMYKLWTVSKECNLQISTTKTKTMSFVGKRSNIVVKNLILKQTTRLQQWRI